VIGLEVLCTSPRFERKGAARALLEPVLAAADTQGITTWLEATPAGKGFYEKLGFETVDILEFDLSIGGSGLKGIHHLRCMERKARITGA
jgi:ribosomal protein S18 acetylase RimI-like enzyme